LRPVHRGCNT